MPLTADTVYSVNNISSLQSNPGTSTIKEVLVLGYYTPGDGGGGTFYWDATSTSTPDGVFIIQTSGTSTGRWRRVESNETNEINILWYGAKGDGTIDNSTFVSSAIYKAVALQKPLLFPKGVYLINSTMPLPAYIHLKGAGIGFTIIEYNDKWVYPISTNNFMFESDGNSYIEIEGITFSGVHTTRIDAFIGMNSYPNLNRHIKIHDCEFKDANVFGAIEMNGVYTITGNTDVYIQYNYFHDLYLNTGVVKDANGAVTNLGTPLPNPKGDNWESFNCNGIVLGQVTRNCDISYNRFENISKDGIFGEGQGVENNKDSGNVNIHHNVFNNCWFHVEINGDYFNYNTTIEANYFYWPRCNGGFCVSVDGVNMKVVKNFFFTHDRCALEYTSIGGSIDDNTFYFSPYTTGEGYATDTAVASFPSMALYGFSNTVSNNKLIYNGYSATGTIPRGIAIVGPNTEILNNPNPQPIQYNGSIVTIQNKVSTGYPTWFYITDNYFENCQGNHIFSDAYATNFSYNVYIKGNIISSRYLRENPIRILGYKWMIQDNTFDFTNPVSGSFTSGNIAWVDNRQTDYTNSLIKGNTVLGNGWDFTDNTKYISYNNTYKGSNNIVYLKYPAPPVTQTQRTTLTGEEGMQVYQTDGTKGVYLFTNGAWKRVDLV